MTTTLSLIGLLVIVVLAIVAVRLTLQVKAMEREQQQAAKVRAQKETEQRAYLAESLRVIALNVLHEDLNLSEAAIRCKMLLDGLLLSEQERAPYAIIEQVYQQVKEFDTHDARKELKPRERMAQDLARTRIEDENRPQLLACFELLKTFDVS